MSGRPTTLVIADDHALTRRSLERLFQRHGVEVVGLAADGREAIELVTRLEPDVVLLDVRMPEMDGLESARRLQATSGVGLVLMSSFDEPAFAQAAGAMGLTLVVKSVPELDMVLAVEGARSQRSAD